MICCSDFKGVLAVVFPVQLLVGTDNTSVCINGKVIVVVSSCDGVLYPSITSRICISGCYCGDNCWRVLLLCSRSTEVGGPESWTVVIFILNIDSQLDVMAQRGAAVILHLKNLSKIVLSKNFILRNNSLNEFYRSDT